MIEITGKYNTAKVFTDSIEGSAREQIKTLCDQSFAEGSTIRLMPDVHAGTGCTIGTTMTIKDKIVPNLVGVDIGCGMETTRINAGDLFASSFDPVKLDELIHTHIQSGRRIRDKVHAYAEDIPFNQIRCPSINLDRAQKSIGTLGGGNHFIEVNRDDEKNLYIVIHSGSRHLGQEIAAYYQEAAWKQMNDRRDSDITAFIARMKAEGRQNELTDKLREKKSQTVVDAPKDLAYVQGDLFADYINDMKIVQRFALINRKAMTQIIIEGMGLGSSDEYEHFTTIHNYIDTDAMILRKGSVSARKGEKLLIPINMRDGSLLCEGLGNPDWNYSAPHGAGRVMSRKQAFSALTLEEFEVSMRGIYSTSISEDTLDESPMAYKTMDEIVANIAPTVKILQRIEPIYNFKAAD
jgi:RNA-splicing ligase RtcB